MSQVIDSREQVLERIRAATSIGTAASAGRNAAASADEAAGAYATLPREYVRLGDMTAKARHERFVERLREYDAEVVECRPEELAATIAAQLAASGRTKFVAPAGLPAEWMAAGLEWRIDRDLAAHEVEQCEGVVTACFCGVAESGTIVLHHSANEGRRVVTLLPDWHLCVVRASQVVETLPEYFALCQKVPGLVTWISGPSATADIEMTRIKGVHGPRYLNVVFVKDRD